jgi:hypothetical protein
MDQVMEQMQVTPPNLSPRFRQLFAIVSIDPSASVYQLHDLIKETFVLVETHLPDCDISQAQAQFLERRESWDSAPEGLLQFP